MGKFFFWMYFAVAIIGCMNGLLLLPVLLAWAGPSEFDGNPTATAKFLMYFQNRKARQIRKQNTRCSFRPRVCVCVCVFCTGGCVVVVTMHSLFCSRCCCTQSFSSFVCVCVY